MLVRPATPSDVPVLLALVRELAEYEREPDAVTMTGAQLTSALFVPEPHLFAHVAEVEDQVIGMAIWFLNFSTWEGRHGIYLEDLYVTPAARGAGAGRRLLQTLAEICLTNGYPRLELSVLDWNTPAIGFYRSIGAIGMDEWTVQRVTGDALTRLAGD